MFHYSQLLADCKVSGAGNDEMKQFWEKCRDSEPKDAKWRDRMRDLVVAITDRLKNKALFKWNEATQDYDDRFTYEPSDPVWQEFKLLSCNWNDIWATAGAVGAAKKRFLAFASSENSTDYCGDLIYFDPSSQKIFIGMMCYNNQVGFKVLDRSMQCTKPPPIDEKILCFETYCSASLFDCRVTNDFWPTTLQILSQTEPMVDDSYWWQLDLIGNHLFNDSVLNRVTFEALNYHIAQRFSQK